MNNEDIKKIAEKILSKISHRDPEKFGSIITVLMIISIVLTLVRVIQECDKNKIKIFNKHQKYQYFQEQIKTIIIRRSWFSVMMAKKAVRRELNKDDYRNYGLDIVNAIFEVGANLKEDEIITLVETANV